MFLHIFYNLCVLISYLSDSHCFTIDLFQCIVKMILQKIYIRMIHHRDLYNMKLCHKQDMEMFSANKVNVFLFSF